MLRMTIGAQGPGFYGMALLTFVADALKVGELVKEMNEEAEAANEDVSLLRILNDLPFNHEPQVIFDTGFAKNDMNRLREFLDRLGKSNYYF